MSDCSNLESAEKWRFQGRSVPVIKGHAPKWEQAKSRDAGDLNCPSPDWSDIEGNDSEDLLPSVTQSESFAKRDDWQLDPYIEDEETGKRMKTASEEDDETESSVSSDHGIDETKEFTARVQEDDDDIIDMDDAPLHG